MKKSKEKTVLLEFKNPGKAVITGASAGLGLSYAKKLAAYGFDLVLIARRKERLREIANQLESEYSIQCEIISADLAVNSCEVDPSSWQADPLAEMASSGHCQNGILYSDNR